MLDSFIPHLGFERKLDLVHAFSNRGELKEIARDDDLNKGRRQICELIALQISKPEFHQRARLTFAAYFRSWLVYQRDHHLPWILVKDVSICEHNRTRLTYLHR